MKYTISQGEGLSAVSSRQSAVSKEVPLLNEHLFTDRPDSRLLLCRQPIAIKKWTRHPVRFTSLARPSGI
ncbi:hypothetical protein J4G07_08895 [Candidatus Poribacteria bacterium]|nr:hypothetical protein [Candidatus Poribacteria bacterium]